jgi:hypothetical protein
MLAAAILGMALACNGTFVSVSNLDAATENKETTFNVVGSIRNQVLELDVFNTSPDAVGGFITGLAFDLEGAALSLPNNQWQLVTDPVNNAPFPSRSFAVAIGASWEGGGSPNDGIGVGEFGVFKFGVNASLKEADVENLFANGNLLVRFRGLKDGSSNKVPSQSDCQVPEPSSVILLSLGGIYLIYAKGRRSLQVSPAL